MITPSYGFTATERVLPKVSIYFTNPVLDSRVSFTRVNSNTATVTNSSGVIVPVAANTPRFDYDPITLFCKGLLIEESRSNRYTYTDQLNNTYWINYFFLSQSATELDPMGNPAWVLASGSFYRQVTVTASATNSFSVYVKAKTGTTFRMREANYSGTQRDYAVGTGSGTNDTFYPVGNGWYRCIFNFSYGVGQTAGIVTMGTVNGDLYVAMPQAEENFATSYMPNPGLGGNVRGADVAVMTGTNFNGWWQTSEGSLVAQATQIGVNKISPVVQFDDTTTNNIITLRGNIADPQLYVVSGGVNQATLDAGTISAGSSYAFGGAWKTSTFAAAINGLSAVSQLSGTMPVVTQARIGSDGTNYLNGVLKNFRYWPQRIINAEIQAFSKL